MTWAGPTALAQEVARVRKLDSVLIRAASKSAGTMWRVLASIIQVENCCALVAESWKASVRS